MNCTSCAHENRPTAKFCEECASPLARVCTGCGAELRPTAKFCDECATPTSAAPQATSAPPAAAVPEPVDTRKVVTIVFADLVGSTGLHERLEPESALRFMESYYVAMRGAVESQGGTVTQLLGDGVKAVFGIPRVAEDDGIRAVRAAVAMQESFRALAAEQRGAVGATGLRVAVNTGEVVANDETEIIGDPVNVAARLQEQGKDGDVVIGQSTHHLVSTLVTLELLGSFALKGRSEAVKAYRVVSLDRPAGAATAPFVGRDEELARLTTVYQTAVEKPAAGLAVLAGSPGLGKSRLIDEFARRIGEDATVVRSHCTTSGGGSFSPIALALRELLGLEDGVSADLLHTTIEAALPTNDPDRARIATGVAALLSGSPAAPEETFFVVRRMLGALAQTRPVVLVIDDLHWAEPLLLDLVEHLIQWGGGVPLLVLTGARPELRDLRANFVIPGGLVSEVVMLGGLDAGAATRLAANVVGATDLPAAIAAKVLATSEGNPLFVGELVRMLVEEGALTKDGDRWSVGANLAALEMPPTIHALLAARIERLSPEERTLLERAAVVGRHFSRSAVAALLPDDAGLDSRLEALQRSELIERDTGWMLGEPVLRFHHLLIRDAAYRRLLKGTRAELHAKLADWIEAQTGDGTEQDETIGWHLEQAHAFLSELGPLDENAKRLGERAAARLAAAGRRALVGDDVTLAASLLGRAIERLEAEDPTRADLALDWCEALLSAGDVGPAAIAIAELDRFTKDSPRLSAWKSCFASQLSVLTEPDELQSAADAVATAARQLTELGDAAGEAKAHSVHAQALARLGRVGACEAALDLALAAARRAGDRRRANAVLAGAPNAALWGPSPVTRASGRCLDVVRVLRITQGAPAVESVALSCQGVLEALRGRTDAARRMVESARKMVEDLGIANRLFEADVFAARIEAMEGDAVAAERLLRGAYEGLRDLGLGIDAAVAGALLAQALLAQDRVDEADVLSHESEALAGDDLQAAIAWRGVRAEALAKRGDYAAAIELAEAAVAIASATDALLYHADACMSLAAALRAAGRTGEADAQERRAIELWAAKGATLLVERAQARGTSVGSDETRHEPDSPRAVRRRVTSNLATQANELLETGIGDADAVRDRLDEAFEEIHHPAGATYGRDAALASHRKLMRSSDVTFDREVLAGLGDLLALKRRIVRASATGGERFDVGEYETEQILVTEVNQQGLSFRQEVFALDRLGKATARLYEWHAELMPEGAERKRAAATARSVGVVAIGGFDADRYAEAFRSDVEVIDHRLLGGGPSVGTKQLFRLIDAAREVGDQVVSGPRDVLALTHDALLLRWLTKGLGRDSGGEFELAFLRLFVFDADGRVSHYELFDDERELDALARFDEHVGPLAQAPVRRQVTENAATGNLARFAAALAARDEVAIAEVFDDSLRVIHHPSGATYGRRELLGSWRSAMQAERCEIEGEVLASLGDALALERHTTTVEGLTEGGVADFGRSEIAEIVQIEVDDAGRCIHIEHFAPDQLRQAIARLYECYAERALEGPERERAQAVARVMGVFMSTPNDLDRLAAVLAPNFEGVDHRHLRSWSLHGVDAFVEHQLALRQVAEDTTFTQVDVLASAPNALVTRVVHAGIDRSSGGEYERPFLSLFITDATGRLARVEWFADDAEAEALALFNAFVSSDTQAAPRREIRDTAATRSAEQFRAVLAARDADALEAFFDDSMDVIHHPSGAVYGRREMLITWRSAMRASYFDHTGEIVATLGDALALEWHVVTTEGLSEPHLAEFGRTETEETVLLEMGDHGRWIHVEIFAAEQLHKAIACLYQRYAARMPEGPERERAAVTARSVAAWDGRIDMDRVEGLTVSPSIELIDHRNLSTWSCRGSEEYFQHWREQLEIAAEQAVRNEVYLAVEANAYLVRRTYFGIGRDTGGEFDAPVLELIFYGVDGLLLSAETWEADQAAEALARFEELVGGTEAQELEEPFANAAFRGFAKFIRCFDSGDWAGVEACTAPDLTFDERRRMLYNTAGRQVWLEQIRVLFDVPKGRFGSELVATRGERLLLFRQDFRGEVADGGGPLELEPYLALIEVDREGRLVGIVLFNSEDLDAAYAELEARWYAGEASEHASVSGFLRDLRVAFASRDWAATAATLSPDFVGHDHRLVGWDTLQGPSAFMPTLKEMVALAPDVRMRWSHLRVVSPSVMLIGGIWLGTRDGGEFESTYLSVLEVDSQGRGLRLDFYDAHHLDRAHARLEELKATDTGDPLRRLEKPNAASQWLHRFQELYNARDWDALPHLYATDVVYDDRQRLSLLSGGLDMLLASIRERAETGSRVERIQLVATAGDRISLQRILWAGGGADGRFEMEFFVVQEVDAEGRLAISINFSLDDRAAAHTEFFERSVASGANGMSPAWVEVTRAANDHDLTRLRAVLPDDFVLNDHRRTGIGRIEGPDAYVASVAAVFEESPDARWDSLYILAEAAHGSVWVNLRWGTNVEGGDFEAPYVALLLLQGDQIGVGEMYELDAVDEALARFKQFGEEATS